MSCTSSPSPSAAISSSVGSSARSVRSVRRRTTRPRGWTRNHARGSVMDPNLARMTPSAARAPALASLLWVLGACASPPREAPPAAPAAPVPVAPAPPPVVDAGADAGSVAFAPLRDRVLDELLADDPATARDLGLHEYDAKVAPVSRAA